MKFVLKLKHWQLFLLVVGIPFGLYIVFVATMIAPIILQFNELNSPPDALGLPSTMFAMGIPLFVAWLVAGVTMVGWIYQVATGLYKKLPGDHTLKIKRFYFAFFYPMAYMLAIIIFAGLMVTTSVNSPDVFATAPPPGIFILIPIIFIMHIAAIASMFYTLYFIAKSLKTIELNREPTMGEYVGDFVLIWFFMIGIWFIQPRINEIFSEPKVA